MFKQVRKQKGLEILEYGLIAALVIGGGTALYVTLGTSSNANTQKAINCLTAPAGCGATGGGGTSTSGGTGGSTTTSGTNG